jgi:FdhD protein
MDDDLSLSVCQVNIVSLDLKSNSKQNLSCSIVDEDTLTLDIADVGSYTLMWTPTASSYDGLAYTSEDGVLGGEKDSELLALALGFMFTEGLIVSLLDVVSMMVCPDQSSLIEVQLKVPKEILVNRRDVTITSSCGYCGAREIIDNNQLNLPVLDQSLTIAAGLITSGMLLMTARQKIFQLTGGSHAAAQMNKRGELLAVCEDLGRHNALDKVIGRNILLGENLSQSCVLLSSRLSLEMVVKAIRAGIQVLAAVGAPTSLAVKVADAYGVTLCGFVREQRLTLFTHPERVINKSFSS